MGLLDELKGIVIDQQRAIRERDAKIGTLQQQYDTLNASYWTVLQRLRSYDHIFSLLTKPMKTNGENGTTENETETKTETETTNTTCPKTEEKPTHSHSKTEPTHSPTTQASLLASMAEAHNGLENKSNLISETIKNFGLERFTGVSMMNMNGLLNGAKPQMPNGTAPNPNQKTCGPNQVALPRCNDVNVIGKTGEGNKPYICKVCGRRFTDRSNCIKHQFIHTGLKPFECPHCGKRFRRKDHLNSHSKSQHGEEAFPPGVPAPRLSIVAATQALPNVIGNAQRQAAGNVSNVLGNALTNGFALGNGLGNGLMNGFGREDRNSNPESPAKKAKIEEADEDDRLVIEEYWMGKENGQIEEIEEGKSEDEIEIESDMPCKVEPTEVETIQEISKEAFERTMAE